MRKLDLIRSAIALALLEILSVAPTNTCFAQGANTIIAGPGATVVILQSQPSTNPGSSGTIVAAPNSVVVVQIAQPAPNPPKQDTSTSSDKKSPPQTPVQILQRQNGEPLPINIPNTWLTGNLLGFPAKPIKSGGSTIEPKDLVSIIFDDVDPKAVTAEAAAVKKAKEDKDKADRAEAASKDKPTDLALKAAAEQAKTDADKSQAAATKATVDLERALSMALITLVDDKMRLTTIRTDLTGITFDFTGQGFKQMFSPKGVKAISFKLTNPPPS